MHKQKRKMFQQGNWNMILNEITNAFAFLLGCALGFIGVKHAHPVVSTNHLTDFSLFIIHAVISGIIALLVKIIGDIIIHKIVSNKKNKDEREDGQNSASR